MSIQSGQPFHVAGCICGWWLLLLVNSHLSHAQVNSALPNAQPLTLSGDIASHLIDGVDAFLLEKTEQSVTLRERHWRRDSSTVENYIQQLQPNRERLAKLLGIVDERIQPTEPMLELLVSRPSDGCRIYSVRWPVLEDPDPQRSIVSVYADGLLLEPIGEEPPVADVIVIPDCDQSLLAFCGLNQETPSGHSLPLQLVERNCRVLVPLLISREEQLRNGRSVLTNREFVYRPSFVLGRHVIGYEVQKMFAAIDWLRASSRQSTIDRDSNRREESPRPMAAIGVGEGGRIALFCAALDQRLNGLVLHGSFGPLEQLWQEPIDRNVFGLLDQFGGAELLSMVAPRPVWIAHGPTPAKVLNSQAGGAPGQIQPISLAQGQSEVERARTLVQPWIDSGQWQLTETNDFEADHTTDDSPAELLKSGDITTFLGHLIGDPPAPVSRLDSAPRIISVSLNEAALQQRAVEELDRHNQLLLRESPYVREQFMSQLRTDSLANYQASIERYREIFRNEIIGHFDDKLLDFNPRVRQTWSNDRWTGYEVVLDVFPDVIAYGALLLPNDLQAGQRRPVIVCQHGLEGRPTDTFLGDHRAYHDFAARLCERGYIVFAPQNLYLFKDRFRSLQRKANPLGKTLFSIIVPQHQQIVNWLKSLPNVDPQRIGFYGLSYGGKSAMRIPALVTDYSLSICSADFNEWVVKNASTRDNFSYVWTGEYEIFEWNLGSTFNYAEMAALICPRPFMVERGHFDGVGTDSWVAYEYAKVRHLYAAQLHIGDRTDIEWFVGPHTINGQKSFDFLKRHLNQ